MTGNLNMQNSGASCSVTRIYGTVPYFHQSVKGLVADLSDTGMALEREGTFATQK